jgi:guanine deaminase
MTVHGDDAAKSPAGDDAAKSPAGDDAAKSPAGDDPAVFMSACIAEAIDNASSGRGGPFAAIVVKQGRSIASGANAVTSLNDPTAHAEIQAIRAAAGALRTFELAGCELFTSCEPCPMCLAAAHWARLDRVYFAATRFDAANGGFDDARLYDEIALPASQRTLPLVQIPMPEAMAPFDAWKRNPNRIPY